MSDLLQLLTRVFSDPLPHAHADFAFLFGQTVDNQDSVLERAGRLLRGGQVPAVGFLDAPALSGYPGGMAWHGALLQAGAAGAQLQPVPFQNPGFIHTRIEAEALARHAAKRNYRTVYVVSAPFHQLRAFMTAVTLFQELAVPARLYSVPGTPLPWQQRVAHSQGQVLGTRSQLVAGEWERIRTYVEKGDLASVETVLHYLDDRPCDLHP